MQRLVSTMILAVTLTFVGCSSDKSSTTAPRNIPAPDGVMAVAQSTSSILITWNDNSSDEVGFKVSRSVYGQNSWAVVGTVASDVERYLDSSLAEGTVYSYFVRAYIGADLSPSSDTLNRGTKVNGPANASATAESIVSVVISWEDMSDIETGYAVERKTGNGRFGLLKTLAENTTTAIDSGLIANTLYTYRIRALKDSLVSAYSDEVSARTLELPPEAPIMLRTTLNGVNSVQVSWRDASDNEEGFQVERTLAGQNDWQVLSTLTAGLTLFTDTSLAEATQYQYRVCAFIGPSKSDYLGPATATTSIFAPKDLSAQRESETSISISWTDVSGSELGYQVQRRLETFPYEWVAQALAANATTYMDTDLEGDRTYTYRVHAIRDSITSSWSNEASAHTTLVTPEPPSDLVAEGSYDWVNVARLSWTDNSSGDRNELGFIIEISPNGDDQWTFADSIEADISSAEIDNLPSESTWFFRVSTYNDFGISAYSNVATCTINGLPYAPTNLTAVSGRATPGGASLDWTDNSASELGFIIEVSEDGVSGWTVADSIGSDTTTIRVGGLPVESTRHFRISAYNQAGNSAYSNSSSAEIVGIPPAPTNLTGNAPDWRSVNLEWQDNSRGEEGFKVERRETRNFVWSLIGNAVTDQVHFVDTTVIPEKSYAYRVKGFNASGQSAATNEFTIDIPPNPPTAPSDLTITGVDIDKIEIGWYDRADNEESYVVERMGPADQDFRRVAILEADVNFLLDTDCIPNSWYTYRVFAQNAAGRSEYCDTSGAATWPLELFEEDFERFDLNAPPGQPWTTNGTVTITNEITHESEKSLHFFDPDSGYTGAYSYGLTGSTLLGTMTAWLYIPHGNNFTFFGVNGGLFFTYELMFTETDTVQVWNGANLEQYGSFPADEWFELRIEFDFNNNQYQPFINDEPVCDPVAPRASGQNAVGGICFNSVAWQNIYVDDIAVVRVWNGGGGMVRRNIRPNKVIRLDRVPLRATGLSELGIRAKQ